jgi:hypothetical protein
MAFSNDLLDRPFDIMDLSKVYLTHFWSSGFELLKREGVPAIKRMSAKH